MTDVVENLERVKARIASAAANFGLPFKVKVPEIIAVSKTHEAAAILPLLKAGHRHFGENRVQEAEKKWPALKEKYPDIVLHLIGPLQSNKAKDALALFDVIHTIDRDSILDAMVKLAPTHQRFLVQINTGNEPQKAGATTEQAEDFITKAKQALNEKVCGLMCIPPADQNPAPHFGLLKLLAKAHGLPDLSMGMSGDYALAAAMGATYVRVGSAIFGERS